MKRIMIVVLVLLGISVLIFLYLTYNKARYNWNETYDTKSEEPFGTLFIHALVKSYAQEGFTHNIKKALPELLDSAIRSTPSAYLYVGNYWDADSLGVEAMKQYLKSGNDAFIICNYPPHAMLAALYQSECTEIVTFDPKIAVSQEANFYHPEFSVSRPYKFTFRIKNEDETYYWQHLDSLALCDSASSLVPLGSFDDVHVNFFKIPYGAGSLYIHTNPILFTNYFMLNERHADYASAVLSHSKHRRIIWDDYKSSLFSFKRSPGSYSNPLYYIMAQPALRYAWWLLVALGLLYVLFTAKRQQRFIPVLEKKTNSSLAFSRMVASIFYLNRNHGDMARKKMRFFLHTVRTRYGLQTHTIDPEFIKKLSLKSQVSEQEIELIFNQYKIIDDFPEIDSAPLINLYTTIQNFYNKAK